jgi:hypothetical protein
LQFEACLPSRPELHRTYPFAKTKTLSGLLFDLRARSTASTEAPKPGSDLEHVQALLRAKGYQLPEAMVKVRFVHLFDEQKRKGLMIIFAKGFASTGFTVEDLLPTGKHSAPWPLSKRFSSKEQRMLWISLPNRFRAALRSCLGRKPTLTWTIRIPKVRADVITRLLFGTRP